MFKSTPTPFKGQNYSALRKECQGKLFEDPEFPPNARSLTYKNDANESIKWMRPGVRRPTSYVFMCWSNLFYVISLFV